VEEEALAANTLAWLSAVMSGTAATGGNLLAGGGANAPAQGGNVSQQGAVGNVAQQGTQGGPNIAPPTVPLQGSIMQFCNHQVPWTSGPPQTAAQGTCTDLESLTAYRSWDLLKDAMKMEETCQMALKETKT